MSPLCCADEVLISGKSELKQLKGRERKYRREQVRKRSLIPVYDESIEEDIRNANEKSYVGTTRTLVTDLCI